MEFKGGSTVSRTSHDFGVSAVDPDGCRLPGALAVLVWVLMCSIRGLPPGSENELKVGIMNSIFVLISIINIEIELDKKYLIYLQIGLNCPQCST